MSRKTIFQKSFPKPDHIYNSYLISFFISLILKSGKKKLAENIVYEMCSIIRKKTNKEPLRLFKRAVRQASPTIALKTQKFKKKVKRTPYELSSFQATRIALRWIIKNAKNRIGSKIASRLADEVIDTVKNKSETLREKRRKHKMAKSFRSAAHFNKKVF
uniref:30S ribosomal protein S7 n=1 Tax=Nitzschia alba TaxID=2858 RepID=A0A5C0F2M3_NITAL|nr:30S ribosomal protein S7 [Nitzschia alba]QEI59606.1 30S ribosomal protein S7 [Nitzschia alba]